MKGILGIAGLLSLWSQNTYAVQLNVDDDRESYPNSFVSPFTRAPSVILIVNADRYCTESIKDAASTLAFGLMKFYTGNNTGDTPGNLP